MQNIAQERETLSPQKSLRARNDREGAASTRGGGTAADGRKGQSEPEPGGSCAGRMGGTGDGTGLCQGLSLPRWGTPLWSKETSMEPPKRREKQQNLPKVNSSPSLSPCRGDDSGGRSTGSPRQAPSPFNLHLPPLGTTLLYLITLLFLTRASDSNSCGPGAAGRGDGEGPAHARPETQLKKVEYGLTKNKHQVSCLPLGYARWRGGGTQGWWHLGRSPLFFLPPASPQKNPQYSAQN